MDTSHVKEFLILTKHLNYGTAAQELGISQSTLSKHIMLLEEEFGVPLFRRTKRSVRLNEFGESFLPYAKRIIDTQERQMQAVLGLKRQASCTLRIGIPYSANYYNLLALLDQFQKEHPDISIKIIEDVPHTLKQMLYRQQLDFAFLMESSTKIHDGYTFDVFASDHLVALLYPQHKFAHAKELPLSCLASEPLLLPPQGSVVHELCTEQFAKNGITPCILYSGSEKSLFELVRRGEGIALLAAHAVTAIQESDILIADIVPTIRYYINLSYPCTALLPKTAETFLLFCKTMTQMH